MARDKSSNKKKTQFPVLFIVVALVVCVGVWGLNWLLLFRMEACYAQRGQFGDMFGASNALFSALAFIGLLVALHMQRKDLEYQCQELEDTRGVLAEQKEQMERQSEVLAKQAFENHFFHMLDLYKTIASEIQYGKTIGKQVFRNVFGGIKNIKNKKDELARSRMSPQPYTPNPEFWKTVYYDLYIKEFDFALGDYFRTLYHTFSFIDKSDMPDAEKQQFAKIIRAQLNNEELRILFINGLTEHGFKPLINKYGLLKHLDASMLTEGLEKLKDQYEQSAFGKKEEGGQQR